MITVIATITRDGDTLGKGSASTEGTGLVAMSRTAVNAIKDAAQKYRFHLQTGDVVEYDITRVIA